MVDVRALTEDDRAWVEEIEADSWSEPVIARLGELIDPTPLPGFIALLDGVRAGLASYALRGEQCELVAIRSLREGLGVGRALLDAVRNAAIEAGCTRLWLITTNDNVRALALYQRWGMELVAFHRHAVTEARRHLKPSIPERGALGIPIAHELELELQLQPPAQPILIGPLRELIRLPREALSRPLAPTQPRTRSSAQHLNPIKEPKP